MCEHWLWDALDIENASWCVISSNVLRNHYSWCLCSVDFSFWRSCTLILKPFHTHPRRILLAADRHSTPMLREYCLDWISKHASEVVDTDGFRTLSSSDPQLVVEILRVTAEPTGPGSKRKRNLVENKDTGTNKKRRLSSRRKVT